MLCRKKTIKNIWMLSREYENLAGAGGVKDVTCQLAESLALWTGRRVHVVLPCYGFMDWQNQGFLPVPDPVDPENSLRLAIDMNEPASTVKEVVSFVHKSINRVHVYLVDTKRFQLKSDVYTYTEMDEARTPWQKKSMGHHDYFAMNLLLQKSSLELIIALRQKPDVIHCHDGHCAVLPALIRELPGYSTYFRDTACLVTIHNAGNGYHQEIEDLQYAATITGLHEKVVHANLLEGSFDPFLIAGQYANLNTVSENYALELQESSQDELTGWLGHTLKERGTVIAGITNGIDPQRYKPADRRGSDPTCAFDPGNEEDHLQGKRVWKQKVVQHLAQEKLPESVQCFGSLETWTENPLFTFIGRLSGQKGVDILLEVVPVFLERHPHSQLVVLGSGESELEFRLIYLATESEWVGRVCFLRGFDSAVAADLYGAGDFFLIPSRYEPCGLTDLIAQLYGNIPVVHSIGGLVKVIDQMTGIAYKEGGADDLFGAMERAMVLYEDVEAKRKIQLEAVREIESKYRWDKVRQDYLQLYTIAFHQQVRVGMDLKQ